MLSASEIHLLLQTRGEMRTSIVKALRLALTNEKVVSSLREDDMTVCRYGIADGNVIYYPDLYHTASNGDEWMKHPERYSLALKHFEADGDEYAYGYRTYPLLDLLGCDIFPGTRFVSRHIPRLIISTDEVAIPLPRDFDYTSSVLKDDELMKIDKLPVPFSSAQIQRSIEAFLSGVTMTIIDCRLLDFLGCDELLQELTGKVFMHSEDWECVLSLRPCLEQRVSGWKLQDGILTTKNMRIWNEDDGYHVECSQWEQDNALLSHLDKHTELTIHHHCFTDQRREKHRHLYAITCVAPFAVCNGNERYRLTRPWLQKKFEGMIFRVEKGWLRQLDGRRDDCVTIIHNMPKTDGTTCTLEMNGDYAFCYG